MAHGASTTDKGVETHKGEEVVGFSLLLQGFWLVGSDGLIWSGLISAHQSSSI